MTSVARGKPARRDPTDHLVFYSVTGTARTTGWHRADDWLAATQGTGGDRFRLSADLSGGNLDVDQAPAAVAFASPALEIVRPPRA